MAHRDIIVIGCSWGGIEALPKLVAGLSPTLNASVFVVIHMSPTVGRDFLVRLLKDSTLPVREAADGECFKPGHIYVAVPGEHLVLQGGHIRLTRGPKEGRARPAVDVLFRSAATAAGRRVIGVVLTGRLDDGTAGLWAVKDRGGIAIVQSVDEATYPSMPLSALSNVAADFELRIEDMPAQFLKLTSEELAEPLLPAITSPRLETEVNIAVGVNALAAGVRGLGEPSFFTCPECHGSMVNIKDGQMSRFRCHSGHAFSELLLEAQGSARVENTLWAALAQLEEQLLLLRQMQQSAPRRRADYGQDLAERIQHIENVIPRVRELALDRALRATPSDDL